MHHGQIKITFAGFQKISSINVAIAVFLVLEILYQVKTKYLRGQSLDS
jgi:hypothetical protein